MLSDITMELKKWIADPYLRAATVVVLSILLAFIVRYVMGRWLMALTKRTETEFDDEIVEALKSPIFGTVVLIGLAVALDGFKLDADIAFVVYGLLKTVAVIVWTSGLMKVGTLTLRAASSSAKRQAIVQSRTVPLFDILMKIVLLGSAAYFALLAWEINVTGWLASAGIVGIALGFAAKDTLANLFAGIFIVADAPYQLGDFIMLDSGERGRVTDIGMRSTRILTRDDIEITVPNAVIGNAKIMNETGGPHELERVRVTVEVAYGSDVDRVREVLMSCVEGIEYIATSMEPRVRFREFGASGLVFQLMAWIDEPVLRGRTIDALNTRVYKRLNEAGIEIPYSKQDVYIKEMPGRQLG